MPNLEPVRRPSTDRPTSRWSGTLRAVARLGTLSELRALVNGPVLVLGAAAIAAVIAFLSMWVGGMITLLPTQGGYTAEVIWWGAPSSWWFYPEVLIVQPWGLVQLPLFPTVAVVLVSIGAALGSVAGIRLARTAVQNLRRGERASGGTAVAAGSAPGIAALATAGACCCSSCASTGGLALVAAASGTTVPSLLAVDWYLPLFQVVIVYVILLAQERALRRSREATAEAVPLDRKFAVGSALRVALLVAGLTWSLAMFVEWGSENPATASAWTWYHWIFEHQLLSGAAVAFALFPHELCGWAHPTRASLGRAGTRVALGLGGVTWGIGVPPALAALGLGGFGNELLGALGYPASWGAVPPDAISPALLAFHWTFQHLLLSGFALAVAIRPQWALRPLLWTVEGPNPPGADAAGSVVGPRPADGEPRPASAEEPGRTPSLGGPSSIGTSDRRSESEGEPLPAPDPSTGLRFPTVAAPAPPD